MWWLNHVKSNISPQERPSFGVRPLSVSWPPSWEWWAAHRRRVHRWISWVKRCVTSRWGKLGGNGHFSGWVVPGMIMWLWINTYRYSLLGEWTSIYQLFWCSPGVHGFDTLPCFAGCSSQKKTWHVWLTISWLFSPKKCPNPWQETPSAMFGYNQKTQRGDPSPSMSGGYQASDMENNHDS